MKSSSLSIAHIVRLLIILSLLGAISAPVAQGQVSFAMPPTYAGFPPGFVADFNGDGKPDILSYDGTLNLGNGDGTFYTGVQLNTAVLAVADFNGDGKPDVYILANTSPVQTAILFGNGDGTFQAPVIVTGIVPLDVWAVDLNGDGKADLLGLSNDGKQLLVYIGNGDGTFMAGVPYNLGAIYSAARLVFADFNSDRKTDVAVICGCLQPQGVVLLGNGDGTFQATPLPLAVPPNASSTVAGDFNGDGKLDLATFNLVSSGSAYVSAVSLQLGNGDGTFQTATTACTIPGSSATGGNSAP
jgi:FG-GAP-like repeat/FG-GAP repeat